MRFSAKTGANGFRVMGHYVPAGDQASAGPLEVEHFWYEDDPRVGRRLRSHVEPVPGPAHEYVVRCANLPHDEQIDLRVASVKR